MCKNSASKEKYVLVLGSNLEDREKFIASAQQELKKNDIVILDTTPLISSMAILSSNSPPYKNQGLLVECGHKPDELLIICKNIEKKIGRKKRERYAAREIDIDIVWWSRGKYQTPTLQIPHVFNGGRYWVRKILNQLLDLDEAFVYIKNTTSLNKTNEIKGKKMHEEKPIYTIHDFRDKKKLNQKITMLTCYDYITAKLLARTSLDTILVGDSLANVFQGAANTLAVTLEEIIYHAKAVRKGFPDIFITADLPYLSYQVSDTLAVENAGRILKESGANAVKLEGGQDFVSTVHALQRASIPVMGHIGLTPQSYHMLGGYRVQGKGIEEQKKLFDDALVLQEAGVFALVLEMVPLPLARELSQKLHIPTIGIGAGNACDGQVLVIQDMLGMNPDFSPRFVRRFGNLAEQIIEAAENYCQEVRTQNFPNESEHY